MTKVIIKRYGWVYVVIVIDWYQSLCQACKQNPGIGLSLLNKVVNQQFPQGVKGYDLHLVADHGCQPTSSLNFMKACAAMKGAQACMEP